MQAFNHICNQNKKLCGNLETSLDLLQIESFFRLIQIQMMLPK